MVSLIPKSILYSESPSVPFGLPLTPVIVPNRIREKQIRMQVCKTVTERYKEGSGGLDL
jgi:hypothetical protein